MFEKQMKTWKRTDGFQYAKHLFFLPEGNEYDLRRKLTASSKADSIIAADGL